MAKYKESKTSFFINPYNFVVNSKVRTSNVEGVEEKLNETNTGYINCEMEVMTPLAMPDAEKRTEDRGHYTYPFLQVNGNYIIPGSSIRGVIRSVYETVTDSCMGTLKPGTTISTRVSSQNAYLPGLIQYKNGEWILYSADRYAIVMKSKGYKAYYPVNENEKFDIVYDQSDDKKEKCIRINEEEIVRYGDTVYFAEGNHHKEKMGITIWKKNVKQISKEADQAHDEVGYVYVGENFPPKKHAESIFVKKKAIQGEAYSCEEIKKALSGLEKSLKVYQDEAVNRNLGTNHTGYAGFSSAKDKVMNEGGMLPVWYKNESGKLFFSLAAIGRKQYRKTVNKMAGEKCESRSNLCKACSLFGMIPPEKQGDSTSNKGIGGRIRFTDAVCKKGRLADKAVTLKELGKPRPSYLPFYAKEGMAYDEDGGNIRGRKYYWHIPTAANNPRVYETNIKNERNASHFLMMPGSIFSFRVYYEKITDQELKELLWCLSLGDGKGVHKRYHHIGHGKPLGLGSIRISFTQCVSRKWTDDRLIMDEYLPVYERAVDENKKSVRDLLMISEYEAIKGENAEYPFVEVGKDTKVKTQIDKKDQEHIKLKENVLANHQWFTQYRGTNKKSLHRILSSISSIYEKKRDYKLAAYELSELDDQRDFERPKRPNNSSDFGSRKGTDNSKNNRRRQY